MARTFGVQETIRKISTPPQRRIDDGWDGVPYAPKNLIADELGIRRLYLYAFLKPATYLPNGTRPSDNDLLRLAEAFGVKPEVTRTEYKRGLADAA